MFEIRIICDPADTDRITTGLNTLFETSPVRRLPARHTHQHPRRRCDVKALSIRQPWADAIVFGPKRTENRTWKTSYRGPLLVHAAAACDRTVLVLPDGSRPAPEPMWTRGALVAMATLTGCHFADGDCCGTWGQPNVHHWTLSDVQPFSESVPCKGRLGLWTPDITVLNAITH